MMEKTMRLCLYQVDAFTREKFCGNPAGVVTNADGLTDQQMQAIARELNNSETAFLLQPQRDDHEVWIRYFTPKVEVPICSHATIAAHYVRAHELKLKTCRVLQRSGIGILPVDIVKKAHDYHIVMTQGTIEMSQTLDAHVKVKVFLALGMVEADWDSTCPLQIVSTGNPKVLIGIREKGTLNALRPNGDALCRLSEEIGCTGYYVFFLDRRHPDPFVHGRMFAPAIGIPEDPVTGNANGPLGAYLVSHRLLGVHNNVAHFRAQQGEAIHRQGIVHVEVSVEKGNPQRVQVGGDAVIVFKTELEVDAYTEA